MADCPFCRIAAGEEDAHLLAETDRTVAFLDEQPAVEGHALVAPREHREHLFSADPSLSVAVFRTVQRVVRATDRVLEPDGVSLFYTTGDLTGTVTHAHVHVVPRNAGDGVRVALDRRPLDDDEAAALAGRVREAL